MGCQDTLGSHAVCIKLMDKTWKVDFHPVFDQEFDALVHDVQDKLLAYATILSENGPSLGRPFVDTLKESRHANMKELRFTAAGGVWRVAFAFDHQRKAILLVAGDKSGSADKRFYRRLIRKADERFDAHLDQLEQQRRQER